MMVFSVAISIIYGIGSTFTKIGILSYISIITEHRESGKNFGFFFAIDSMYGYFSIALIKYYKLSSDSELWIMIGIAMLFLSLKNPEKEAAVIK